MENREWSFIDKSDWPKGEWHSEPDKVQFADATTGLPCLIVRGKAGALCGYVGVAEGHPLYGVQYSDDSVSLDAHGGITYSDFCFGDPEGHTICHVAGDGEPDKVWWFGFDCLHLYDRVPKWSDNDHGDAYRDIDYVKNECRQLAEQLAAPAMRRKGK